MLVILKVVVKVESVGRQGEGSEPTTADQRGHNTAYIPSVSVP